MEKISHNLTKWLIDTGAITEKGKELYEYATYSCLITISPLFLAIIIGGGMGLLLESILIIIPFMAIRKFSGGYHMKNPIMCFATSCLFLIFCIGISENLTFNAKLVGILLVSTVSLMIVSPIDSQNRRLEKWEQKCYKKITSILAIIFLSISFIFAYIGKFRLAICIAIGIIFTAGLQLEYIIKIFFMKKETK